MKRSGSRLAALLFFAVLSTAGCSTVIKTASEDDVAGAEGREALRAAAADVAWAPWPKPSSSTLAERLAGHPEGDEKVSRDDAVKSYVARIERTPSAEAAILTDANRHLSAARALTSVAIEACDGPGTRLSDVALLEAAISDLRETRAIYLGSFKKLDAGDGVADRLADLFDEAIKDLGDAADELAENAIKMREEAFAGPGADAPAGSL